MKMFTATNQSKPANKEKEKNTTEFFAIALDQSKPVNWQMLSDLWRLLFTHRIRKLKKKKHIL